MLTPEFKAALELPSSDLKLWLRQQRKGVKFYSETCICYFPSGAHQLEVHRTPKGFLCVNPACINGVFAVGQPFGYAVGHLQTGKLLSPRVFPSAATVRALVGALETCGINWCTTESIPSEDVDATFRLIQRVYSEKLRP